MLLRASVLLLASLLPASGHAQNAWQAPETRFDSALAGALSYLRAEKPRPAASQLDNLNLWQPGMGFGAQVEVAKNWAVRLDVDRYRPKFPGGVGRESLDTVMVGIQYRGD